MKNELADGTVAGTEEVDAQVAQARLDGVGVEVPAGNRGGKEPWAFLDVAAAGEEFVNPRESLVLAAVLDGHRRVEAAVIH